MSKRLALAVLLLAGSVTADAALQPDRFRGTVEIRTISETRINVLVDTHVTGREDGFADHGFGFKAPAPLAAPINTILESAEVTVLKDAVCIYSPSTREAFIFSAGSSSDVEFPGHTAVRIIGNGMLSHHWGPLSLRLSSARGVSKPMPFVLDDEGHEVLSPDYADVGGGGGNAPCQAGGNPSASCSIGPCANSQNCSVSCPSNTYSCCNCSGGVPSCHCYYRQ